MKVRVITHCMLLACLANGADAGASEAAGDYPNKPLRVVVGYAPGGPTDVILRPVAQKLSELMGQPVVVDNRPGANGNVGAESVAKSSPDGYTLLTATLAQLTNNPHLYKNMGFDTYRDLQPVSLLATSPGAIVVNPGVPAKSLKELIALAKKQPGKLNFSSTGNGSANHLAGELLKLLAGIEMVHVPFKGGAPALNAVVSGDIQVIVISFPISMPLVKAGRLRALAIADKKRSPVAPELPTTAEAGLPGMESRSGPGIVAPSGTPKAIIATLHGHIVTALGVPELRDRLTAQGLEVIANTPEEFEAIIREDSARWSKVIRSANVRL